MGYTHYWTFKPIKRGETKKVNAAYKLAIKQCHKVLLYWQSMADIDERLSGYSAHTKIGQYGGISFNGKADLSHEDFVLREHYKQNINADYGGFCKTAQKPYDTVVVACLVILKHYLGDQISINSDGRATDWAPGTGLARAALGTDMLKNPIRVNEQFKALQNASKGA